MRTVPRPWPAAVLGVDVAVALGSVVLSLGREPVFDTVCYALNAVVLGIAGFLVTSHRPGHRLGVLLTGTGLDGGLVELAEGYGYHHGWPAAVTATWVSQWASFLGIGATVVLPALFPDGRSLSRRWRPVVPCGVIAVVLVTVGTALGHHTSDDGYPGGVNPYAVPGPLPDLALVVGQVLLTAALLGAVASFVVRYRRSDAEERLQMKWLVWVIGLLGVVGPPALYWYDDSVLVQWGIGVTVTLIPVAVCVAIVRHRLFDIDVVISRTLVYGLLSGVLAATWVATSALLGVLLAHRHASWVTAGATVAACAIVAPVRRRVQDVVDRRFRRARHEALARVDGHLEALRTGRAEPGDLQALLRDVLDLPDLRLRYVLPGSPHEAADEGADDAARDEGGRTRTVVHRAGAELAVVEHPGPAPALLHDVLARAGLAIEIARLQAEVAARLEEVQRSRERIVAAGDEERRRLERDLHDGAQQRLVAVGLALRHVQHELGECSVSADLDSAVLEVGAAITDLRELAHGVRPASLGGGLALALAELAGRTPLAVELDLCPRRFTDDVEATAYFVASEALTNAVKHAHARAARLRTEGIGPDLVLTISDDGVGGATVNGGSGLRGLGDRVAGHGGDLTIRSSPGAGTTLVARLPCGS